VAYFKTLSQQFTGETKEGHAKYARIAGIRAQNGTFHWFLLKNCFSLLKHDLAFNQLFLVQEYHKQV